jgi:hypothetical protein
MGRSARVKGIVYRYPMMSGSVSDVPKSELILRNAYRVLGLPGEAGWQEIEAAAARERGTGWDLPWLGTVTRTPARRGLALNRLVDPYQRLRERLFWFHEAAAEEAVEDLEPAFLRNAMEGWAATTVVAARHDAALVALLAAIVLDPHVEDAPLWRTTLMRWREVLESEEYWVAVIRVEREGAFEFPAPFAEIYELRENALAMIAEVLNGIARSAVLSGDTDAARRAIEVLRETLPKKIFDMRIGNLAGRLAEDRVVPTAGSALDPFHAAVREIPSLELGDETAAPVEAAATAEPSAPAEEPAREEPTPLEPLRFTLAGPPRAPTRRTVPLAAAGLALAVVAAAFLLPVRDLLPGGERPSGPRRASGTENRVSTLPLFERELETNDETMAAVLLERRAAGSDVAQLEAAVRDYQALIDDYQRRAAYRLNIDRQAYARVVRLHAEAVQQYEAARARRGSLDLRYARLREREAALIAEYNRQVP